MHYPLAVRRVERVKDLAAEFDRPRHRHRPAKLRALDILHDEIIRPDIVKLANMRMVQRRNRPRLPLESRGKLRPGKLNRNDAIQPRIPRLPHLAHPARANRRDEFIGSESGAGREHYSCPLSFRQTFCRAKLGLSRAKLWIVPPFLSLIHISE